MPFHSHVAKERLQEAIGFFSEVMIDPDKDQPSVCIAQEYEICQARDLWYPNGWIFQAGKKHLQVTQGIQKRCIGKWTQKGPEQDLRRVPHKVQGEVNEHAPGEGEEPDIPAIEAKDR